MVCHTIALESFEDVLQVHTIPQLLKVFIRADREVSKEVCDYQSTRGRRDLQLMDNLDVHMRS